MTKNPFKFKELQKKRKKEGPKLLVQLIRQTSNKVKWSQRTKRGGNGGPIDPLFKNLNGRQSILRRTMLSPYFIKIYENYVVFINF